MWMRRIERRRSYVDALIAPGTPRAELASRRNPSECVQFNAFKRAGADAIVTSAERRIAAHLTGIYATAVRSWPSSHR